MIIVLQALLLLLSAVTKGTQQHNTRGYRVV